MPAPDELGQPCLASFIMVTSVTFEQRDHTTIDMTCRPVDVISCCDGIQPRR